MITVKACELCTCKDAHQWFYDAFALAFTKIAILWVKLLFGSIFSRNFVSGSKGWLFRVAPITRSLDSGKNNVTIAKVIVKKRVIMLNDKV